MKRLFLLALLTVACTDSSAARETLEKAGFKGIRTTGFEPFACSKDDTTSTGFTAINPAGAEVEGVVCCGLIIKACTIRF